MILNRWGKIGIGLCVLFMISSTDGVCEKVQKDIVLLMHLDEGSGTMAQDSSSYANHGTLTNMEGREWTAGKFGNALRFDGKDDYVDCGNDASLNITTAISVECWVKTGSSAEGWMETKHLAKQGGIVAKDDSSCNRGWMLVMSSGGEAQFYVGRGVDWQPWLVSTDAINDGVWHHLVGVDDGNTLYIYKDGKPYSTLVGPHSILTHSYPLCIGKRNSADLHFKGIIDEVCIYNRALNKKEIEEHYRYCQK